MRRPSPVRRSAGRVRLSIVAVLALVAGFTGYAITAAVPANAATTCYRYMIIGVPGSGEENTPHGPHNMGNRVGKAADAASGYLTGQGNVAAADIAFHELIYPAVDISPLNYLDGAYASSVLDGINYLVAYISSLAAACPTMKLILIGYSQGAQVIHEAVNRTSAGLTTTEARKVVGVLLVADPDGDLTASYNHMLKTDLGYDEGPASSGGGAIMTSRIHEPIAHRTFAICFDDADAVCRRASIYTYAHGTYDTVVSPVNVLNYWGAAVARFTEQAGQRSTGAVNDGIDTTRMFVRGTDNLDHETYLGSGSSTWSAITGGVGPSGTTVASDPVAVVDHKNTIYVFVRGADTKLYVRVHTVSGGWAAWKNLGGSIVGRPKAVVDTKNNVRVYVHGVGASGHLDEIYLLNGSTTWSVYVDTGLVPLSDPSAVVDYDGTVRVYAIDTNHNLVERYLLLGGTWSAWNTILGGGALISVPTAIVDPRNIVRVYVRDTLHIWEASLVPDDPPVWGVSYLSQDSTGYILSTDYNPIAISDHDDIIRVYASAGTTLMERYLIPGHSWSNWGSLNGTIQNPIAAVQDRYDRLYVFVHNANDSLGQDQLSVGSPWTGIVTRSGLTLAG